MSRTINKRLERLTKALKGIFVDEFDEEDEDPSFIEALGLDPTIYESHNHAGAVRYDHIAALNATATADWKNYADEEQSYDERNEEEA